MSAEAPRVSVVVPVKDGERYLAEALDSALAQRGPSFEVVVVDDGSTDGTAEIAGRYGDRIRYVRVDHGGAAAARNHAIGIARGELLAFLDADDVWTSGRLALLVAALDADPTVEVVAGHVVNFASPELSAEEVAGVRVGDEPLAGDIPSATVMRRAAFERVGPFSREVGHLEWAEWSIRARRAGLVKTMLPEVVARRRVHTANVGRVAEDPKRAWLALVRDHLRKSREAG